MHVRFYVNITTPLLTCVIYYRLYQNISLYQERLIECCSVRGYREVLRLTYPQEVKNVTGKKEDMIHRLLIVTAGDFEP